MSFDQMLEELPLSLEEEELVEARLAEHSADPDSSIPVEEVRKRLSSRFER